MRATWERSFKLFSCVLGTALITLSGCSSTTVSSDRTKREMENERWAVLTQQLKDQAGQIERLSANIEALKLHDSRAEDKDSGVVHVKVKKLKPSVSSLGVDDWEEAATVADSSQEAMNFYYTGQKAIHDKEYEEAIKSFQKFLDFSPNHVYADRAQYLIEEAHFQNREYGLAVVVANWLTGHFPNSVRVPDALFKRALCFELMGHEGQAREAFQAFVKRFPKHALAQQASRKIAELSKGTADAKPALLIEDVD